MTAVRLCEGCNEPLGVFDALWDVCMDCTKARHRAVVNRSTCSCGVRKARPKFVDLGFRNYYSCKRCHGVISEKVMNSREVRQRFLDSQDTIEEEVP